MDININLRAKVTHEKAIKILQEAGYEYYPDHEFKTYDKRYHNRLVEVTEKVTDAFDIDGQMLTVKEAFEKKFTQGLEEMINHHLNNY